MRNHTTSTALPDSAKHRLASDAGFALAQVAAVSAILFVIATMLLALVVNQQIQSSHYAARTRTVHMADAGINAYLYELRRDPNFWVSNTVLGPRDLSDGTWQVWATPPQNNTPLTLRSVGTIPSAAASRTVVGNRSLPHFRRLHVRDRRGHQHRSRCRDRRQGPRERRHRQCGARHGQGTLGRSCHRIGPLRRRLRGAPATRRLRPDHGRFGRHTDGCAERRHVLRLLGGTRLPRHSERHVCSYRHRHRRHRVPAISPQPDSTPSVSRPKASCTSTTRSG